MQSHSFPGGFFAAAILNQALYNFLKITNHQFIQPFSIKHCTMQYLVLTFMK